MEAKFIKNCSGFTGDARLYELSEPIEYDKPWDETCPFAKETKFVVVSATIVSTKPETYIFAANKDGRVIDWGELDGSYQGGLSHEEALTGAGYLVEGGK